MFFTTSFYRFICDDCFKREEFYSVREARSNGWAISKNYRKCYCPKCAPFRRNVGCKGVRRRTPFTALNGENRN